MNESVVEQVDRFSKNLNPKTSLAALHRSFKDGLFLLHSFVELALTTGNQKRRKIRRRDPRFHVDALLVQKRRYRLPDRPSRRQLFSTTHTPTLELTPRNRCPTYTTECRSRSSQIPISQLERKWHSGGSWSSMLVSGLSRRQLVFEGVKKPLTCFASRYQVSPATAVEK